MRPVEWAYIAGFFDGEGCVTWSRGDRVRLIITQKDPDVLVKIQQLLGYGRVVGRKPAYNGVVYWELRIGARAEVEHFARHVVRHSVVKKAKLRKVMREKQPL